jgi:hypothetical protein
MKKLFSIAVMVLALSSCASSDATVSDINLTDLDSSCASNCVNNYSYCVERASMLSFSSQCATVLKLCSQTCKPRKGN